MDERDPQKGDPKIIDINSGQPAPADPSGDLPVGDERLARLQAERDELMQTLVRRQADFENYRKRIERERADDHKRGVGRLIEELLPILDAFDRGLKATEDSAQVEYRKGLEMIYRQLWDALARQGLERIQAKGKQFDPHYHQAIERVETSEYEDGEVVEVLQDGFLFHGRVLRPSIVRVAVHSEPRGGGFSTARRHSN